jgi:hypothetical protein
MSRLTTKLIVAGILTFATLSVTAAGCGETVTAPTANTM